MAKVNFNKKEEQQKGKTIRMSPKDFDGRGNGLGDSEVQKEKAAKLAELYMELNSIMADISELFIDDNQDQMAMRLHAIGEVFHIFKPGVLLKKSLLRDGCSQEATETQSVCLVDVRTLYGELVKSGIWDKLKQLEKEQKND